MWTITVSFVIFLAVAGNFGCASTAHLNHRSAPLASEIPTASSLSDDHSRPPFDIPALELAPNAAPGASLLEIEEPKFTHDLDPTSAPEPVLQTTQQPGENREDSSQLKDSSRDQAIADNRLLELLDRDLDKAVEQPSESRLPMDMFPVLFAIPRTSGWIAQWEEMLTDPDQKLARPKQVYLGAEPRDYLPIEKRD